MNNYHNLAEIYPYSIYDIETKQQLLKSDLFCGQIKDRSCLVSLSREPEGFNRMKDLDFKHVSAI